LARNARRSEAPTLRTLAKHSEAGVDVTHQSASGSPFEMPTRAKALFDGIDLDLSKPAKEAPEIIVPVANPLADTLRVKLNLARAYMTIEDFSAAKKSIEEVLRVSNSVDPAITIEAQGLLAEISHRNI